MTDTADHPTQALPPQDLDAEESLLGAMMLSTVAIERALDTNLAARDFYRASHGVIYDAIVSLYANNEGADPITVADRLAERGLLEKAGGQNRVSEIASIVPAASNAGHYARIVREQSVLRAMLAAGNELRRLATERGAPVPELVEEAERTITTMSMSGRQGDFIRVNEPLMETIKRLHELSSSQPTSVGVPSGFSKLDELTAGFEKGNLVVIAARPSMGKSGLALNIAAHVAVGLGKPVGLFTLEMSRSEVTQRLLSAEALVGSQKIRLGRLNSDDWGKVTAASSRLDAAPLYIDDSGAITALELRSKARRLKLRNPDLALILVDYLQLLNHGGSHESRQQDVSATSRALKVLASELEVPVIALSQLSRQPESRHDKRPMLSDLRESGSIEQDADLVMFIYRDDYYHPEDTDQEGIAEVNLAKHRNGPTGTIKLAFVKRYTRFTDLAS